MHGPLAEIPEIQGLSAPASLLRIPDQIDVPVTRRIQRLIDCPEFYRLRKVSQLGLVGLVYPGATHNRFEHSLGVYRNALLFIQQLASVAEFNRCVDPKQATCLILAALLHDIGHYPFCHPIEDLNLPQFEPHESLARQYLLGPESKIASVIQEDFGVSVEDVLGIIEGRKESQVDRLLASILSGPIDVDKVDYLYRDSLHSGVPYGRHFDSPRLIRSLCLNRDGSKIAITHKGRTAAELLVFARYVMFSEVYWHHAVRSATAMLQRAVFELFGRDSESNQPLAPFYQFDDRQFGEALLAQATEQNPECARLLYGLFGPGRDLYKRVASFSCLENEPLYRAIARKPYPWLAAQTQRLAEKISALLQIDVNPVDLLLDAPPEGLEVQFDVEVYFPGQGRYRSLGEVSPMINTLAKQQFDDMVKQVRLFASAELAGRLKKSRLDFGQLMMELAD